VAAAGPSDLVTDWKSPTVGSLSERSHQLDESCQVNRSHRSLLKSPNPNNQGTKAI
jgi:hypothetical protein